MVRDSNSSRAHERHAVYHYAALLAEEETRALATRVEDPIAAVKATRRAREDAEDARSCALAGREVAANRLDHIVRVIAAEAEAADRRRPSSATVLRLFPLRTAAVISTLPLEDRLSESAKLAERMTALGEEEGVRALQEDLAVRIGGLQTAKAAYAAAIQEVAAARVREEVAQLSLRRTLGGNRGKLIEMYHGDMRAAATFFRSEPRRAKQNGTSNGRQAAANGERASTPGNDEQTAVPADGEQASVSTHSEEPGAAIDGEQPSPPEPAALSTAP